MEMIGSVQEDVHGLYANVPPSSVRGLSILETAWNAFLVDTKGQLLL